MNGVRFGNVFDRIKKKIEEPTQANRTGGTKLDLFCFHFRSYGPLQKRIPNSDRYTACVRRQRNECCYTNERIWLQISFGKGNTKRYAKNENAQHRIFL